MEPDCKINRVISYKFCEPVRWDRLPFWFALVMILGYVATWTFAWITEVTGIQIFDDIGGFLFHKGHLSDAIWSGEVWRLVTHAFLHGGMFHLFGNLVMFLCFTMLMQVTFTKRSWLIAFAGSVVVGGALTILFTGKPAVGASIGIMGLLGALVTAEIRKLWIPPRLLPATQLHTLRGVLFLVAMQFTLEWLVPNVGHAAHLCGFAVGFAIGVFLPLVSGKILTTSRPGLVEVTNVKYKVRHLPSARNGKAKDHVVEELEMEVDEGFDPSTDYIAVSNIAFDYRGRPLARCFEMGILHGVYVPSTTPFTVASRYEVQGHQETDKEATDAEKTESEAQRIRKAPAVFTAIVYLLGLGLAYLLYLWWGEALLWKDEQLAWLNFLPQSIAPKVIELARVSGALLITISAALLPTRIVHTIGAAVIAGFCDAAKKRTKAN